MMSDLMPKEFYEAFRKHFGFSQLTASASADAYQMLKAAEWAWQASRECLVIELPKPGSDCYWEESVGDEDAYFDCGKYNQDFIEAIHAAGVKTK